MPKKIKKIGTTFAKLPSDEGEHVVLSYYNKDNKLLYVLTRDDRRIHRRYDLTPEGKFQLTGEDQDANQLQWRRVQ